MVTRGSCSVLEKLGARREKIEEGNELWNRQQGQREVEGGTLQCFVNAQKVKPENCAVTLDLLPLSCPLSIFFFFFFCLGDLVCGCKQQNTKWPLLPSADGAANMETRSLITESTEAITGRITSLLAGCSINWFWLETNGAAPLCFNAYSRYIQVKIIQSLMYSYFCVKERERLFIIIWHSLYSI